MSKVSGGGGGGGREGKGGGGEDFKSRLHPTSLEMTLKSVITHWYLVYYSLVSSIL